MNKALFIFTAFTASLFVACKKDHDPIFNVPPTNGAQVQLNGLISSEPGSAAGNSVYLDLSSGTTTPVARASWDLGFYCGSDFRVILNNTTGAGAKLLSKNDLTLVDAADTVGLTLSVNQLNPLPSDMAYFDDINGSLAGTVVPEVSANATDNKVIIINRGTGGGVAARPWIKIRVLRNAGGGYTLQYAGITAATFKTLQINKDAAYHFRFVSFDKGLVNVEPEKARWDIVWSYSLYMANFGAGMVPYSFSDMIATNYLSGIQVKEIKYTNAATANAAYTAYNMDSVHTISLTTDRWGIGSKWRSTQPATGARLDRFYIIKDYNNNYYKLKCLAMGIGGDGGTRGKPEFKFERIQ